MSTNFTNFTENLSELAKHEAVPASDERERELLQMVEVLTRQKNKHPILVGEYGVGRSSLLLQLAGFLQNGAAAKHLRSHQVCRLDVAGLYLHAGDQYFASRLEGIVNDCSSLESPMVLFFDEAESLLQHSKTAWQQLLYIFQKNFSASSLIVGLVCDPNVYFQQFKRNRLMSDHAEAVWLSPLSHESTLKIVKERLADTDFKINADDKALLSLIAQAELHIKTAYLPASALSLLDKIIAHLKLHGEGVDNRLDDSVIQAVLAGWQGVYMTQQAIHDTARLKQLSSFVQAKIFGQDRAIQALNQRLPAVLLGLRHINHCPVFCFTGPKGVGKHTTAMRLQALLYGEQQRALTLDLAINRMPKIKQAVLEHLNQHAASLLVFQNAQAAQADDLSALMSIAKQNKFVDEFERQHTLTASVMVLIYQNQADDLETNVFLKDTTEKDDDDMVQLGLSDLPEVLQSVSLATSSAPVLSENLSASLPDSFLEMTQWIGFDGLQAEALLSIMKRYLKRLAHRVLLKTGQALQVQDNLANRLLLYFNCFDKPVADVIRLLDEYCLPPLSEALLNSDDNPSALHLSFDENGFVSCG